MKSYLFNCTSGVFVFTIESNKIISIYIIKSYINQQYVKENATYYLKQSLKISNFRMAKRASLELEFTPKRIEFFGDYFLVIYKNMRQ